MLVFEGMTRGASFMVRSIAGMRRMIAVGTALLVALPLASAMAQRGRSASPRSPRDLLLDQMIRAEDLRGGGAGGIAPLASGLLHSDAEVRRVAVRGLGRMENPALLGTLASMLEDSVAAVRIEAANAIAQAARGALPSATDSSGAATPADSAFVLLRAAARHDGVPEVLGAFARSIGRLPYTRAEQARTAEEEIAGIAGRAARVTENRPRTPAPVLWGAAHGLFTLARARRTLGDLTGPSIAVLRSAAVFGNDSVSAATTDRETAAEVRRLGWLALVAAGHRDDLLIRGAARDADTQVRRIAVLYLANVRDPYLQREILVRARGDTAFMVRLEWVRMYRQLLAAESCTPLLEATRDPNTHVRLAAIDALGTRCREGREVAVRLAALAAEGPAQSGRSAADSWHERAHALVALARADSAGMGALLARSARDPVWQVRLYASRAATVVKDVALLRQLARDSVGSVRMDAIEGLAQVAGHGADDAFIAALGSTEAHVVLAAARALEGTPSRQAALTPLLEALDRLTRERRETTRDPRLALLARLEQSADSTAIRRLAPYARDFDPVVAARAAALLTRLTGREVRPSPERLAVAPVPEGMMNAGPLRIRITVAARHGGGSFVLRLDPRTAPASVARVLALARRGYYTGLTWHRVAPNFVVQGGSPSMNEYVGDGPFMRDELGMVSHRRGTVGISTRGRDTGDAQLFINLVDNYRLDHDYTVAAVVESGMDVVDRILEGAVMERVEVLPA